MSARGRSSKEALEEAARAAFAEGFRAGSAGEVEPEAFKVWWSKVKPRTCSYRLPECMGGAMQTICTCTGRLRL